VGERLCAGEGRCCSGVVGISELCRALTINCAVQYTVDKVGTDYLSVLGMGGSGV